VSKSHPEAVIDALYSGNYRVIERYVNEDNINLVDEDGHSLLSRAATAIDLNTKIVRLLVKRGADVNIRLREGGTLLHFAAHLLRKDLAAILLRAGCDPNATNDAGETALSKVLWAFNPKADLVEILLEHGADPTMKQPGGESALELAARTRQSDLFPPR
jgi:ankyrin repeat protein